MLDAAYRTATCPIHVQGSESHGGAIARFDTAAGPVRQLVEGPTASPGRRGADRSHFGNMLWHNAVPLVRVGVCVSNS